MKFTSLVLFCFLSFCIISCKKSSTGNSANLTGTWDLRQASGMVVINYTPNSGNTLVFTDSTYKKYSNGALVKSRTYRTVKDASYNGLIVGEDQFKTRVIYDDDTTSTKIFFQLSGHTLKFISGSFADDSGSIVTYEMK